MMTATVQRVKNRFYCTLYTKATSKHKSGNFFFSTNTSPSGLENFQPTSIVYPDQSGDERFEKVTSTFLNLEEIDPLLYRSTNNFQPVGRATVFGGQVVGQALVAASKTIEEGRDAHSLHCYFLRPGWVEKPILYHVKESRDGQTYSNRFVEATQDGKSIFTMMVSFKRPETDAFQHQFEMPVVPPPEELKEMQELLKERLKGDVGEKERSYIENQLTTEVALMRKPVDPSAYFNDQALPARQYMWFKTKGYIGDNQPLQKCAAAFISDTHLIGTALQPAGKGMDRMTKFAISSVDHAIWFHHPVRADDWLLYEMESPQCGNGRALALGRMWDKSGKLVLSVTQEGVIRTPKKWQGFVKGQILEPRGKADNVNLPRGGGKDVQATAVQSSAAQRSFINMSSYKWINSLGPKVLNFSKRVMRLF